MKYNFLMEDTFKDDIYVFYRHSNLQPLYLEVNLIGTGEMLPEWQTFLFKKKLKNTFDSS